MDLIHVVYGIAVLITLVLMVMLFTPHDHQ